MKPTDTRKKLREKMDEVALKLVEEAGNIKLGGKNADEKEQKRVDIFKVVTQYLSVVNRQPEENEGAAIHEFRSRLSEGTGGGGATGDGGAAPTDDDDYTTDDDGGGDDSGGDTSDVGPAPNGAAHPEAA